MKFNLKIATMWMSLMDLLLVFLGGIPVGVFQFVPQEWLQKQFSTQCGDFLLCSGFANNGNSYLLCIRTLDFGNV